MRQLLLLTLFFILSTSSLKALNEESILVKLATENQLEPLLLLPIESHESCYDERYLKELEKILFFDLAHNGKTSLIDPTALAAAFPKNGALDDFGSPSSWPSLGCAYVVKVLVEGDQLKVALLEVTKRQVKIGRPYALSGDLDKDRRELHKVSDSLYRALFGSEGIALTKILYALNHKNGKESSKWVSSLYECDFDGKKSKKILQEPNLIVNPLYIPPKKGYSPGAILFVSYESGQSRIRIAALQNGRKNSLIKLRGSQLMPTISSSGDKIAFISDATGNPDLFMQPFNLEEGPLGKPQQIFAARHAAQASPTFSPDGKKIAFVSNKDGSPRLYVVALPPPGTSIKEIKPQLITRKNRENTAPAWSPDGQKLAYCARNQGERQIWVYDFTTREERMVSRGTGDKENPSWAPNSLVLVYNSSDKENNDLFLLELNGNGEGTQITFGAGDKRFPNWEPR